MAKTFDIKTLVYQQSGPKKKETEYKFGKREFKRYPPEPGTKYPSERS